MAIDRQMKQIVFNLVSGVCGTLHAIGGTHCPSNILPPPERVRFAQTAFIVVLPRIITKYHHAIYLKALKNKR